MAYDGNSGPADTIKVFVSYSRADTDFARDLVKALQACGFEAFIDQEDIAPGEPWEQRLGGLIESADTIVYVLSPDSLSSEHCAWEITETLRLNKRLLPVVWRPIEDHSVPENLSQLNYIFFSGTHSFADGLNELSQALRVDYVWIREHTRIAGLARRWDRRGRTEALLLRGDELDVANAWADRRPRGAPALTDSQIDYLAASKAAYDKAERDVRNRRRGLLIGVSAVAVAMSGLALGAVWQWQQAEDAKGSVIAAYETLNETNDALEAAYLRLSADIALRAPPTGREPFQTSGGWFPVAANYSGAVVRLQKGRQIVTGFMIDGAVIHPGFSGQPLVLTPRFRSEEEIVAEDQRLNEFLAATDAMGAEAAVDFEGEDFSRAFVEDSDEFEGESFSKAFILPDDENSSEEVTEPDRMEQRYVTEAPVIPDMPDMEERAEGGPDLLEQRHVSVAPVPEGAEDVIRVSFPTLKSSTTYTLIGDPLWQTPPELAAEPVFSVYELSADMPFGARAIEASDLDCETYKDHSKTGDRFALFGIDGASVCTNEEVCMPDPGAMSETALMMCREREVCDNQHELTLLVTDGLELTGSGDITYRHATLKGAFGAPVFDLESGKVIGIHQGVDANQHGPGGRVGFAEPLLPLIDRIRDGVSIDLRDESRTPPLCEIGDAE